MRAALQNAATAPAAAVKHPAIQMKTRIGPVDDPLEREADRVADAVVAGRPIGGISNIVSNAAQRKCAECEEEERSIQRKEASSNPIPQGATDAAVAAASSAGAPLTPEQRAYFEPRFRQDFSTVRLHADGKAAAAADAVNARAFTLGDDIAFGPGEYAPQSAADTKLLAHELAHVVQQRQSHTVTLQRKGRDPAEKPAPAAFKGKGFGGLTVSSASEISAERWVEMIKASDKLDPWMKDLFAAKADRIVLTTERPKLPAGLTWDQVPEWFKMVLLAINSKEWHLTTGVSIVSDPSEFIHNKLLADVPDGDRPVGASKVGKDGFITGETTPSESKFPKESMISRRMMDDRAQGTARGGGRRAAKGKTPAEGLIVVANRFRDKADAGIDVLRDDANMVETLFHELAAHAALDSQMKFDESAHGLGLDFRTGQITEADKLAFAVWEHFGKRDQRDVNAAEYARWLGPTGQAEFKKEMDDLQAQLKKALADLEAIQRKK